MEELLVSLMPPRSSMSPLVAGVSSSMLRGDLETECLRGFLPVEEHKHELGANINLVLKFQEFLW